MNTRSIHFRLTVWHALLLATLLAVFGIWTYLGLKEHLELSLEDSLAKQAEQIGETLIVNIRHSGEPYVVDEIKEHFAPEINGRFVRVTRSDRSVLYVSGLPKDGSFDPARLPSLSQVNEGAHLRKENPTAGGEVLVYSLPFQSREGDQFLIEVGAPYRHVGAVLEELLVVLAVAFPVAILLAIGGGYLLMRRALKPVAEITSRAEGITSRNLSERLPVAHSGDELERLSVSLNRMIARLEESFQHTSRFTADASHELRTPLTILRGELEAIVQRPGLDPEVRETIGSTLEETERLAKIVENLLAISRLDAGEARMERAKFDLAELAKTTTEQMRLLAEDRGISLRCDASSSVEVEGDKFRIKQIVVNLLDNAIKYTRDGGAVEIKVTEFDKRAVLEVKDNGMGIPADALPHVFERFYRVDKARSRQMGGAGLGLSIV
jgi:heavy metal sensor kinase